jgi:hypothetical protein
MSRTAQEGEAMFGLGSKGAKTPDASLVASRARLLTSRVVHAMAWPPPEMLPGIMEQWSAADCDTFTDKYDAAARALRASLESSGAWADASPDEKAFFSARLTERTQQQCVDSSWAVESIACCAWALNLIPVLPAYDSEAEHTVMKLLPPAGTALSLRSKEELEHARSIAELWHWRSRTRWLMESGQPVSLPNDATLDQVVRLTARAAAAQGDIPEPCDEDFPALGKAYRDLSAEEYSGVTSIAAERHKALNWICGMAPKNRWDETPTDT